MKTPACSWMCGIASRGIWMSDGYTSGSGGILIRFPPPTSTFCCTFRCFPEVGGLPSRQSVGTVGVPFGVELPSVGLVVGVDEGTGVLVAGVVLAFGVTLGGASAEAERATPGQNGIGGRPGV